MKKNDSGTAINVDMKQLYLSWSDLHGELLKMI